MQTAKTTILEDLLKSFGDLAVKIPADGKEQYSIVMLYDNQCKYCNDFLMNIPNLTAHGVSVFVMPFLNHGAYSQQAKSMYLA